MMDSRRTAGVRRVARLLAVLVIAAVMLTGCGVRPTPVTSAGPAPGGRDVLPAPETPRATRPPADATLPTAPPGGRRLAIYLVLAGKLQPMDRSDLLANQDVGGNISGEALYSFAVQELFRGPLSQESRGGLTTAIPSTASDDSVTLYPDGPEVHLGFSVSTSDLPPLAALQISCTVARVSAAVGRRSPPQVNVVEPRGLVGLPPCPVDVLNLPLG